VEASRTEAFTLGEMGIDLLSDPADGVGVNEAWLSQDRGKHPMRRRDAWLSQVYGEEIEVFELDKDIGNGYEKPFMINCWYSHYVGNDGPEILRLCAELELGAIVFFTFRIFNHEQVALLMKEAVDLGVVFRPGLWCPTADTFNVIAIKTDVTFIPKAISNGVIRDEFVAFPVLSAIYMIQKWLENIIHHMEDLKDRQLGFWGPYFNKICVSSGNVFMKYGTLEKSYITLKDGYYKFAEKNGVEMRIESGEVKIKPRQPMSKYKVVVAGKMTAHKVTLVDPSLAGKSDKTQD